MNLESNKQTYFGIMYGSIKVSLEVKLGAVPFYSL